jgi:hypothetical protein
MNAIDWHFLAEGNIHFIVVNQNSTSNLCGKVLRLVKKEVNENENVEKQISTFSAFNDLYRHNVMINWFSYNYISGATPILLSSTFLIALMEYCALFRTSFRKNKKTLIGFYSIAYLERNVSNVYRQLTTNSVKFNMKISV